MPVDEPLATPAAARKRRKPLAGTGTGMPECEAEERAKRATNDGKRGVQARAVFATEDVAAAALQPFRHANPAASLTATEFKWVLCSQPSGTLVYAWTITSGVTGESGKQRKRVAASGLGALLAALRHHHGPDDTAEVEKEEYQNWRRVDRGSGTAAQRLAAIKYLEKRLGVPSGGSWQDALEVVSLLSPA
jgi:hypothetical protein